MTDIIQTLPYPESYWVKANNFMAGEYPARYDELDTRRRLQALIRSGIFRFIDLTHPQESKPNYHEILLDEGNGFMKKMVYSRHPIEDRYIPSENQMVAILDEIDNSIAINEPVYVHCAAGIGRTGTVVGCHLVRHGLPTKQVLSVIDNLRRQVPSRWVRSPESDEQVEFIMSWKQGL